VLAFDHFHLIMLADKAVTLVRQRVIREQLDRRGEPHWVLGAYLVYGLTTTTTAAVFSRVLACARRSRLRTTRR